MEHRYLLTDGVDVGPSDFVRTGYVVFKVNLFTQIHLAGDRGEYKTFLPSVGDGELNFPVQTAGT